MKPRSRRIKILAFDTARALEAILERGKSLPDILYATKYNIEIPDDLDVIDVKIDDMNRSICFLVQSESFPEVPSGQPTPYEFVKIEPHRIERLRAMKNKEGKIIGYLAPDEWMAPGTEKIITVE